MNASHDPAPKPFAAPATRPISARLLVAGLLLATAVAQELSAASDIEMSPELLAIEGDVEWGEYLSAECATCHRRSADADTDAEGIPSISGWPEEAFVVVMHAYRQKLRPNPVMQLIAGRLSDEEIAALAAYYAESIEAP